MYVFCYRKQLCISLVMYFHISSIWIFWLNGRIEDGLEVKIRKFYGWPVRAKLDESLLGLLVRPRYEHSLILKWFFFFFFNIFWRIVSEIIIKITKICEIKFKQPSTTRICTNEIWIRVVTMPIKSKHYYQGNW